MVREDLEFPNQRGSPFSPLQQGLIEVEHLIYAIAYVVALGRQFNDFFLRFVLTYDPYTGPSITI